MKVNSQATTHSQKNQQSAQNSEKMSRADVQEKIKQKFGDSFKAPVKKTEPVEDKVEIQTKKTDVTEEEAHVGLKSDIGKNDPDSEVTQEKLKSLLQTGAFQFNDRERKALGEILKP